MLNVASLLTKAEWNIFILIPKKYPGWIENVSSEHFLNPVAVECQFESKMFLFEESKNIRVLIQSILHLM